MKTTIIFTVAIALCNVLNVLLTYHATAYLTIGYGLHPVIAGSIGVVNTLVMVGMCLTVTKHYQLLMTVTGARYRVYQNGAVFHQDEFSEISGIMAEQPYGIYLVPDDYSQVVKMGKSGELPDELVTYILDSAEGQAMRPTEGSIEWIECVDNDLFSGIKSKYR